ncbi:MAG: tetratricopeptide repeat protein [Candidatus Sericytochromatia bacterium]|nr:tetratricopeptide repeat protein [Candidatus Sericytochromatia bacterium]
MSRRSFASLLILLGASLPAYADHTTPAPPPTATVTPAVAVQASPTDVVLGQVEALEAAGSQEAARQALMEAITTYPTAAILKVRLGRSYAKAGDQARARDIYQGVLAAEPDNTFALGAMGLMMAKGGNQDQAVVFLRKAAAAPDAETPVLLALAKLIDSNHKTTAEADALYVEILKRDPSNIDVRLKRAQLANFEGDAVAYRAQLQTLIADAPTTVGSLVSVAQLLSNEEETRPRATSLLRPVFELAPKDGTVAQELMNNLVMDKQFAEVTMLSQRWAEADPQSSMPWHYICTALDGQSRMTEACDAMRKAITLAPDDAKGYLRLAKLELRQKNWPAAEQAFKSAITKSTGNADPILGYADALSDQKRTADALIQYRQALKVESGSSVVHLRLGRALHRAGQSAEAKKIIMAGLKIEPEDAALLSALKAIK